MKNLLAILACIPFLFPAPALAATRRCNAVVIRGHHVQHHAVVLQQFAQPYAYQVGAGIQQDALAERVASLVLQKLVTQQGSVQAQGGPAEAPPAPQPNHLQSCVRCHNPDNAKGDFDITGELSCETRLESIRRMLLPADHPDHMPKGKELSPQELGDALGSMSGVH